MLFRLLRFTEVNEVTMRNLPAALMFAEQDDWDAVYYLDNDGTPDIEATKKANRRLINMLTGVQKKQSESDKAWVDMFQTLISHGHRYDDLLDYPVSVFFAFAHACNRRDVRMMQYSGIATRAAGASEKNFKEWLNHE